MSFSSSPNLGQGLGGWRPLNFANAVTLETENDPGLARSSTSYAYARTTEGGGSFALDFQWPTIQVNYSGDTQNGDAYGGTTGPRGGLQALLLSLGQEYDRVRRTSIFSSPGSRCEPPTA